MTKIPTFGELERLKATLKNARTAMADTYLTQREKVEAAHAAVELSLAYVELWQARRIQAKRERTSC